MIITDYKTLSYEIPTHRVYGFGDYSGLGDDEPYFKNYNDRFINLMIMDVKTHIQNKWVAFFLSNRKLDK